MIKAENLVKGQKLKVELDAVKDRLPQTLINQLTINPYGNLVGYKMVDGNDFGLVLELSNGNKVWFFERELSEASEK